MLNPQIQTVEKPSMVNTETIKLLIVSDSADFWAPQLKEIRLPLETQIANQVEVFKFLLQEWTPEICLIDSLFINPKSLANCLTIEKKPTTIVLQKNSKIKLQKAFYQAGTNYVFSYEQANEFLRDILVNVKLNQTNLHPNTVEQTSNNMIEWHDIKIFPNDYLVKRENEIVNTSPVQFKLLLSLVNNHDQLLSREWLQEFVWNGNNISPRSIDAQISKLKKLLPSMNDYLVNVYGKGYILSSTRKRSA